MTKGPEEEPPARGPAGRGRGTAVPAWMKQGVGATATSEIDKMPSIPVEEKKEEPDLLAEIFDEREAKDEDLYYSQGRKQRKGKKGKGKGKKRDRSRSPRRGDYEERKGGKGKDAKAWKFGGNEASWRFRGAEASAPGDADLASFAAEANGEEEEAPWKKKAPWQSTIVPATSSTASAKLGAAAKASSLAKPGMPKAGAIAPPAKLGSGLIYAPGFGPNAKGAGKAAPGVGKAMTFGNKWARLNEEDQQDEEEENYEEEEWQEDEEKGRKKRRKRTRRRRIGTSRRKRKTNGRRKKNGRMSRSGMRRTRRRILWTMMSGQKQMRS